MLANFEATQNVKREKNLPPTANPAPTTMHPPTLANGFSFCPILASASFQSLLSCCARCFPSKSSVLRPLRTPFPSWRSFRRSPRLFSIICGLFLQNTGGGGYPCDMSAPSAPLRYHLPFFAPPLFSSTYKSPSSYVDLQHSLFSSTYKSLFPQLLCIRIYTKRRGVGSKLWLTTDSVTPTQVAAASSEESKNSIVTNETLE